METTTNHSVGISSYQKRLIDSGWIFSTNEIVTNYHLGTDYPGEEPLRTSFKRLREDCKGIYPRKRVEFFRAYNTSGERIPCPYKEKPWEGSEKDVSVVAIYVKDLE